MTPPEQPAGAPQGDGSPPVAGEPLVEELRPAPPADLVFRRLSALPRCIFFDSALAHPELGRYSFVAADPFDFLQASVEDGDAFARVAASLEPFRSRTLADLPPFQGGAAGLFAYDLNRQLERIPAPRWDEFGLPGLAVGLYDVVVAIDHHQDRAWIVSHGFPEREPAAVRRRAAARLHEFQRYITHEPPQPRPSPPSPALPSDALAPQFPAGAMDDLTSNFSRPGYLAAIQRVIDYIYAGDIFQANLSQRLLHPARDASLDLYERLRTRNAAPFAGYFDLGDFQILSASPERFVRAVAGQVEARPIKGTRQRTAHPEADLFRGDELRQSEKDRAENVMIVDLLRNDLSRVCTPDSLQVTQLCELENYAYVQHLVSAICGRLQPGLGPLDLLRAVFPGGSITGAPKVRAMEIIAELEPTARGAYCGSLAYVGFDGTMDASILIRTITSGRGWWQAPVGGGIVAASDPVKEYEETWYKAEGLLRAIR